MGHLFVAGALLLIVGDTLLLALDSGKSHLNDSKQTGTKTSPPLP